MIKTKNPKISIIDYGVGNLHSIFKAVGLFTGKVSITDNAGKIAASDAIILPGDGAFKAGMFGLKEKKIIGAVKKFIGSSRPVLGICLGAQILMTKGLEFGEHGGLDIIPGKVVKFANLKKGTKVPQIGWNTIGVEVTAKKGLLAGLSPNPYFYFVHSFIMVPDNKRFVLATSRYGGGKFCSVVGKDNVFGCQFHPEKSGKDGLKIIENFVKLI